MRCKHGKYLCYNRDCNCACTSSAQVLETARAAFEASNQKVSLTNLSGRRDMSLLLALSACQVRKPTQVPGRFLSHFPLS